VDGKSLHVDVTGVADEEDPSQVSPSST
jgi:hypothetical protein